MLIKCVHIRSSAAQHAAEVLSGVPLGAIITAPLKKKRGGSVGRCSDLPRSLHKSNPLRLNGPQIQCDGQFVAVVYSPRTSSSKENSALLLDMSVIYEREALALHRSVVSVNVPQENQFARLEKGDAAKGHSSTTASICNRSRFLVKQKHGRVITGNTDFILMKGWGWIFISTLMLTEYPQSSESFSTNRSLLLYLTNNYI